MSDEYDLSLEDRARLARLPQEMSPPPDLEDRTVRALRGRGLLGRRRRLPWAAVWIPAIAAASLVLFLGGVAVGQWLGARSTSQAMADMNRTNARQVAALVQRTGSAYNEALQVLGQVADSGGADRALRTQSREVALNSLYTAAARIAHLYPDDPLAVRILQTFNDQRAREQGNAPTRRVVWF